MTQTRDSVLGLLREIKCDSPLFPSLHSLPITVNQKDTFEQAFKVMIENQISSVPIIHKDTSEVISVLSLLDMVDLIVDVFSEEEWRGLGARDSQTWQTFYSRMLGKRDWIAHERLDDLLSKRLLEFESLDPVYSVSGDSPLLIAVDLMVSTKSHRVVVMDTKGHFANFITQSRLLELLVPAMAGMPLLNTTIQENPFGSKHVISISEDEMAYKAFKLMKEKAVSGLAVVNKKGQLQGSISVSDIKLIEYDLCFFNFLGNSVKEYLRLVANPELTLLSRPIRYQPLKDAVSTLSKPVIKFGGEESLGYVMTCIIHYRIHRVYVVDQEEKPQLVISLHDLLSLIMNKTAPYPV